MQLFTKFVKVTGVKKVFDGGNTNDLGDDSLVSVAYPKPLSGTSVKILLRNPAPSTDEQLLMLRTPYLHDAYYKHEQVEELTANDALALGQAWRPGFQLPPF